MAGFNTYRETIVWQKAMAFVTAIYKITSSFPTSEQFTLTSQMRRSAISIPSNVAEGFGRRSTGDFVRFLQISTGSLYELQTQVEIAFNLQYVSKEDYDSLFSQSREIERLLSSLIQKLKEKL
ncbi:four helix bundle protein [Persicitalea jodogahamensis]|uniref:Four helix bundle protein n=1 Tax=Persicitalea jodogahamensis TaxID=402147 RepID=A0A8J3D768_9BACT|nr:four helix bundle protein [Persicitalea jodogahamensis]GHB70988.1 four helix bundle protein [Persicitalea jodogahamensis]